MPVTPTYPGVYIQEVPSGVRTIVGVSTSVALFIGRAKQGLMNKPIQCFNFGDFERAFSSDSTLSQMARYVKLFFLNGGTQAYVLRIANGATAAQVTLQNENGDDVLQLTAKQAGLVGENIRAAVTYSGAQPEATFNLSLFRWDVDSAGRRVQRDEEVWQNLSMDPNSPVYAPAFLTQNSKLVDATLGGGAPAAGNGFSQSGRAIPFEAGNASTFRDAWSALTGTGGTANRFQISVNGSPFVTVNMATVDIGSLGGPNFENQVAGEFQTAINNALSAVGVAGTTVTVSMEAGPDPGPNLAPADASRYLRITSDVGGDVLIRPAAPNDAAVPLTLGAARGGLEVSGFAALRPAPNGITLQASDPTVLTALAEIPQATANSITLPAVDASGNPTTFTVNVDLQTTNANDPWFVDALPTTATGNMDGVREKLGLIRDAINDARTANPRTFFWKSELWGYRLAILPTGGAENSVPTVTASASLAPLRSNLTATVRYGTIGVGGTAGLQTPAAAMASDGTAPQLTDYQNAFQVADREIDLFNLMILPPDLSPAVTMSDVHGPASVFCQERRAFLLMDPPEPPASWTTAQAATSGIDALRIGVVKDYSAIFFPRLTISENGRRINLGSSGAIAGLMARIDGTRGVWKAPAGTEADLRGVVGLEFLFSDSENGALNPRGINTLRVFPNGIVNWGARTNDGDDSFASEYKYIPIRRLALFIEESLYRGLKWVVFEPNDEPLWAQIRLNVGAFMQDLFRKGAFQGQTPKDAYFVKVDRETTTQNDQNLGIVNIWVGFAPLKPAEFVILYLQQMAGQIQV